VASDLDVEMGYRYDSPAVCHDGDPGPLHENPRESHARVGTRAPHAWVVRGGERISTIDLFGRRFVILAGPKSESWTQAVLAAADDRQLPFQVDVYQPGLGGFEDPDGALVSAYGLTSNIALIRPDGFVAWRSKTAAGSPSAVTGALSQAICTSLTVS
jgi:putative polyketide hydroxylase